ncbi:MAG: IucA/IucC family protein [Bacteroidota bacterium]
MRLIYAAFREGILKEGQAFFTITYADGSTRELNNEYDVIDIIYTKNPLMGVDIHFRESQHETFQSIDSLELFWLSVLPSISFEGASSSLRDIILAGDSELISLTERTIIYQDFASKGYQNFWLFLQAQKDEVKRNNFLMQLASFRGNPTHPLAKLKKGFEPSDIYAYSPECGRHIDLPVIAIARGLCKFTRENQSLFVQEFFGQHFPETLHQWEKALQELTYNPIHYYPVPVHPFQIQFLSQRFADKISQKEIVFLHGISIPTRATISIRTLMPTNAHAPYIKLPLNIQTTSMLRTHSPPRVHAGPVLTRLLHDILLEDEQLSSLIRIIPEPLGIYIDDKAYIGQSQNPSYHLNVLYKGNPLSLLEEGEISIPLSAAFEISPCSGKPILIDLMQGGEVMDAESAMEYFQRYAEIVIRAQLGIYAKYGIAVEAHQQNTYLILDESARLTCCMVGDLAGGIEIYASLLKMNGINILQDMHPTLKHIFDSGTVPEQQIIHTTFFYHLIPFARILCLEYDLDWHQLLRIMKGLVSETIHTYRIKPVHIHQSYRSAYVKELDRIEQAILQEPIQVKSVFHMSLAQTQETIYTIRQNLFADKMVRNGDDINHQKMKQ